MTKTTTVLFVALAMLTGSGKVAAQVEGFQIVVNAANPTAQLPAHEVSRLFMKKVTLWADGQRVDAVDLDEAAATRARFSQAIHQRDVQAIKAFWRREIFSGRSVPPSELPSEAAVLERVRTQPNAIGYVSAGATLPAGVKALAVTG